MPPSAWMAEGLPSVIITICRFTALRRRRMSWAIMRPARVFVWYGPLERYGRRSSGTVVASFIECDSASLNAVPAAARLYVDRRLTAGETPEAALAEIAALPSMGDCELRMLEYDETSWRGERARQDKFYPAWVLEEGHPLVQGVVEAVREVTGETPRISRWGFSTNGVATAGRHGIPSVGFAPGIEELSHTTEEWVAVDDLVSSTAVYSLIPEILARRKDELA